MKIVVAPEADADIDSILDYLSARNLEVAQRFLNAVRATFDQIGQQPSIGHQEAFRRALGIRSWRVEGFGNYLVFYRVAPEQVEILRLLHGARNLPRFFRS